MVQESAFADYVMDLLEAFDGVRLRAMFGGYGLFQDDVMFALIGEDTLYLKADQKNRPLFEKAGMTPFVYSSNGKAATMSYYETPPEALEDADAMQPWAESAIAASRRARKTKRRGKPGLS